MCSTFILDLGRPMLVEHPVCQRDGLGWHLLNALIKSDLGNKKPLGFLLSEGLYATYIQCLKVFRSALGRL
jgi:hypothetical protein